MVVQYADAVFQIGVRSRVAASLDLERFCAKYPESVRAKSEHLMEDHFALMRRKHKEAMMNERLFENRVGSPVCYGEAIQLLHVSSGKCLSVSREETSKTEPENFRILLSEKITPFSWFKMLPAAAINSTGDLIGNLSGVILSPLQFTEEAVHVSAMPMAEKEQRRRAIALAPTALPSSLSHPGSGGDPPGAIVKSEIREVNASFDTTVLRVVLFTEVQKNDALTCGALVYVEDAEGKTCLRPLSKDEQVELPRGEVASADQAFHLSVAERMKQEIVFAPADEDFEHSSAIWVVERPEKTIGGVISWNESYTLRHLKTGSFLSGRPGQALVLAQPLVLASGGTAPEEARLRFGPANASTLRKTGDEEHLHDCCATVVECCEAFAFKDDENAVYLGGRRFVRSGMAEDREKGSGVVLRLVPPEGKQQPVRFGLNARNPMLALANDLRRGSAPAGAAFDCENVADILDQLCGFVVLDDIKDPAFQTKLSHSIQPILKRQIMMREQDCISILLDIISSQRQLVESGRNAEALLGERTKVTGWSMLTLNALLLLRLTLIRNPANQNAVAARISVLLSYVGTQHSAEAILCLAELFGNRRVQERIGLEEIRVFVRLLRANPLSATALGVMEKLCVCNGVAIESNQQLLVDHVLGVEGIISSRCVQEIGRVARGRVARAAGADLPVPVLNEGQEMGTKTEQKTHAELSEMEAELVVREGEAQAAARHNRGKVNEHILVHIMPRPAPDVTFEFLFPGESTPRLLAQCDEKQSMFLTAQLNLLSAMCLDRMYVSIETLKHTLPFGHIKAQLVRMGSDDFSAGVRPAVRPGVEMRSAFVRLAAALYIDIAPQIAPIGTDMTFVWSHLIAPENMQLPGPTDVTKVEKFRPLQVVISEELESVQMNTFTTSILDLQTKLLDFHFYNENFTMLQGAVAALVKAISGQVMVSKPEDDAEDRVLKHVESPCTSMTVILKETLFDRKWVLRLLDSIPAMLFILGLVFAAITVMLVQGDSTHYGYATFEQITFVIFLVELIARMMAVNNTLTFFSDPFGVIDFVVVLLDAMMLLDVLSFLGGDPLPTKALRTIRMLRLIRAFRMVKLAMKIRQEMRRPKPALPWTLDERFTHSSLAKLVGLTRMLDVLLRVDDILGKHRFSKLLAFLKRVHGSAIANREALPSEGQKSGELARHSGFPHEPAILSPRAPLDPSAPVRLGSLHQALDGVELDGVESAAAPVSQSPSPSSSGAGDGHSSTRSRTVMPMAEVLAYIVDTHGVSLNVDGTGCDVTEIMFTMIMYEWPPLVQNSIQLLMHHHESTGRMVDSMQHFQLVAGSEGERLFAVLRIEITELWNLMEMNELWRHMRTDSDVTTGLRVIEILAHMRSVIIEPNPLWLGGGHQYRARGEVQVMLRNLGALEVALLIGTSVESIVEQSVIARPTADRTSGEGGAGQRWCGRSTSNDPKSCDVARGIFLMCNEFLCWFIHNNEENQTLVFRHLSIFEDDITSNMGSTAVIMEMVRDNPELIKFVPQSLFDNLMRWFELQPEADPDAAAVELLRLLVLCRGGVLADNQLRVFKLLMTPQIQKRLFICGGARGANNEDVEEREQLMTQARAELENDPNSHLPFADAFTQAIATDGDAGALEVLRTTSSARIGVNTTYFYMPRKLQFHVQVLKLMATCAGGKINIIEAKVQTLFPVHVLLETIMDPSGAMLADVAMPLTNLLYDTYIHVQFADPQTNVNPRLWDLLESYLSDIEGAAQLVREGKGGVFSGYAGSDGGRGVRSKFKHVFDELMPLLHDFLEVHMNRRTIVASECRSDAQLDQFLLGAHAATNKLYTLQPECMSPAQGHSMLLVLRLLARATSQPPPPFVSLVEDGVDGDEAKGPVVMEIHTGSGSGQIVAEPNAQDFYECMNLFARHGDSLSLGRKGMEDCASRIQALPRLADPVDDEIRYEPLLKKMIRHAQDLLEVGPDRKTLAREYHASTLWVLQLLRTMIEVEWGFTFEVSEII
jgi:fumarate reductase subunit C